MSTSSSSSSSSSSTVEEVVRREVPDWDDDVASTARFKALSGQRPDWEPKLRFWRDLIVKVARHLGTCTIRSSEVKSVWFARGGLTPLCMDQVLHEMRIDGDILSQGDLIDPTSGRMYQMFRRVGHLIGNFRSLSLQDNVEDTLILKTLLQERAADIIKILTDCNWTSSCIITLQKFQSLCKGSGEASAILSYLSECGKARYFSIRKKDLIEGVKLSLVSTSVPNITRLDYDTLHLIWTAEKLQQQHDVIDQRWENARKLALASFKLGNKQVAYRHIRQSKLFSESRVKCTTLLERVEEVLRIIADAESTKNVSEAIQIGARAIKENKISVEEIHIHLQELDENIIAQKLVNEALEATPVQSVDFEDEDLEEEFKKLEMELADEMPTAQIVEPVSHTGEVEGTQGSAEMLSQALSNLNLQPEAA
ncbi:charged multivesicular body protein 7 [Iris pallida]|uniref:Charged multivesicular body protein 7 n=1 Tax=Iris pallida TaxID=29817 RepID=A0AAX6IKJ7_IRIPA|nr:charged multivesicular body protein 7 [Iris pallida]